MRMVYKENAMLSDKLQSWPKPFCPKHSSSNSSSRGSGQTSREPGRVICPADVEDRLQEYSNTTTNLEKQLYDVEQEVRNIQHELIEVQKEREYLEHRQRVLCLPQPYAPPPCPPYSCGLPSPCGHSPPCVLRPSCCPPEPSGDDQQFRELKEKYTRLQEDFKDKEAEVASLRTENEKFREMAERDEENRTMLEQKVQYLERTLRELKGEAGDEGTYREQLIDLQQQLKVHKELSRQAEDELEELRAFVEDIQGQLDDYRNKEEISYLKPLIQACQVTDFQRPQTNQNYHF